MQYYAADDLYGVRLDADNTPHCLTAYRESVGKDIFKGLTLRETCFQHACLALQLLVGHSLIHRLAVEDCLLCPFYSL